MTDRTLSSAIRMRRGINPWPVISADTLAGWVAWAAAIEAERDAAVALLRKALDFVADATASGGYDSITDAGLSADITAFLDKLEPPCTKT